MKRIKITSCLSVIILSLVSFSCQNRQYNKDASQNLNFAYANDFPKLKLTELPSIAGHLGQEMIIGNFTGQGLDTIWVVERVDTVDDGLFEYNYHTKSSNPLLPSVELYGRPCHCAFIINEGDLDGDGKDEWAWMRGSFKSYASITYHLLHFDNDKWLEFSVDLDSDTRESDIDVVRKGSVDGSIILSFLYWSEEETSDKVVGYDTIFNPFQDAPMLSEYD